MVLLDSNRWEILIIDLSLHLHHRGNTLPTAHTHRIVVEIRLRLLRSLLYNSRIFFQIVSLVIEHLGWGLKSNFFLSFNLELLHGPIWRPVLVSNEAVWHVISQFTWIVACVTLIRPLTRLVYLSESIFTRWRLIWVLLFGTWKIAIHLIFPNLGKDVSLWICMLFYYVADEPQERGEES